MKKIISLSIAVFMAVSMISCASTEAKTKSSKTEPAVTTAKPAEPEKIIRVFNAETAIVDNGSKTMKGLSGMEVVYEMKTGWNLGNTLDATGGGAGSETSWGQPKTTKEMIDFLASSGFKTIRIPTTWHNHIIDNNYTIDPKWMSRVKEIVDWAIENDMYVILNIHHDNFSRNSKMPYRYGYYPTDQNKEESISFLTNIWKQIALAFNNGYDEHLVFETLNEPRLCGTGNEWNYSTGNPAQKAAQLIINEFNQEIVNVIRASGGNNAKRLIVMPGYACTMAAPMSADFKFPADPANNLGVAVHMYDPYTFAMDGSGTSKFSPKIASDLQYKFKQLEANFTSKGIPVYIGEYGAVNKENPEDRAQWFNTFIRQTRKMGIPCILWDNQAYQKDNNGFTEKFGYFNRKELTWFEPDLTKIIIDAADLK